MNRVSIDPNVLRWSDYEPFALIGEPHEPTRVDDSDPDSLPVIDAVLADLELDRVDGGERVDFFDFSYEHLLHYARGRADLVRLFGDLPQREPVLDRLDRLMRARGRTPKELLQPDEAVSLVHKHLAALVEHSDRVIEHVEHRSRRPELIVGRINEFLDFMLGLDVRWVDETAATGVHEFSGYAITPKRPRLDTGFSPVLPSEELLRIGEQGAYPLFSNSFDAGTCLIDGLEDARNPSWYGMVKPVSGVLDFGHAMLLEWVFEPVWKGHCNSEHFFRLWECGASIWFGSESLEVRTDWADRWPHTAYRE